MLDHPAQWEGLLWPQLASEVAEFATALRVSDWQDQPAAELLVEFERLTTSEPQRVRDLSRWVAAHPNDPLAVSDCVAVNPPSGIAVLKRLSRDGSQKIVFLCTWDVAQSEIVLKRFRGESEQATENLMRETLANVLSQLRHRNIMPSQTQTNSAGEVFLIEEYLHRVLSDDYRTSGIEEAASMLYDIGNALAHMHDHKYIHGDVKPPNMGMRGDTFVLLDFGLARPAGKYPNATPTGSLRTRAPELLTNEPVDPYKADIWALGASIFNAVVGRYPLFDEGEKPPRASNEHRDEFEKELGDRVRNEWGKRVALDAVAPELREIVGGVLARQPDERPTADRLVNDLENKLGPYLRHSAALGTGHVSVSEEIKQYGRFLRANTVRLMPQSSRHDLQDRLRPCQAITNVV